MAAHPNYLEVIDFIDEGLEKGIFPLQTTQSLAKRWGVSIQVVNNWSKRHKDFPKPINIVDDSGWSKFYPLFEVEKYEQLKNLFPKQIHQDDVD